MQTDSLYLTSDLSSAIYLTVYDGAQSIGDAA